MFLVFGSGTAGTKVGIEFCLSMSSVIRWTRVNEQIETSYLTFGAFRAK